MPVNGGRNKRQADNPSPTDVSNDQAAFDPEQGLYQMLLTEQMRYEPELAEFSGVLESKLPLCIDCDGTLIKTDLLHEAMLNLAKRSWTFIPRMLLWLLKGKASFKQQVSHYASIDFTTLPYRPIILKLAQLVRQQGRKVVLVTAAPERFAASVSRDLDLFDEVFSSSADINLAGRSKAALLESKFGTGQFIYVGNGRADLPVWAASGGAVIASSSSSLQRAAAGLCPIYGVVPDSSPMNPKSWLQAIRIHQWLKNFLIFVPLGAAHKIFDQEGLASSALAFAAFCLCSSAVYLINDLLDLPSDRLHARKRKRPFASGALPVAAGVLAAPMLLLGAMLFGAFLPALFALVMASYFVLTILYSFWLKGQVIVDVMLLATLYTTRILAGAAATSIVPSFWLLAFSMFVFLCLAFIKRYSEIRALHLQQKQTIPGRGYAVADEPVILSLGSAAGYGAVLILSLYINSSDLDGLYPRRWLLWLIMPPVLYWISRVWLKAHRNELHDDPIVFAVKDRQSWAVVVLMVCILVAASH
jgi:4-hydroxybenzoate polyprenyltransferase/phosphoserine phosphatase